MSSIKVEIAKNLTYYRKKSGLTQKELAEKLGVRHNSISAWENEKNSIDVEVLFDICEILNVTINDMYGVSADSKLTQLEDQHINRYRQLTEPGKSFINKSINDLLAYESEFIKTTSNNLLNLDQYKKTVPLLGIVSAGNGIENYFDKEDVEVEDDCQFALIVRGDSMDPAFHDGQIIGIKKQDSLENGEIGIVEWISEDGSRKAYLKKWYQMNGHIKLVSLNKNYDDIIIEKGNVEVRGKVSVK